MGVAYFVWMIDLKDSKKMSADARRESQARLKEAKNAVNRLLKGTARLEFSSGDSVQGYADDAACALRVCLLVVFLMQPYEMHCGIGAGEIYVLDDEGTNASDGPAYHDALKSLERSKKEAREIAVHTESNLDELINCLLSSVQRIRESNTEKQNLYVAFLVLASLSEFDADLMRAARFLSDGGGTQPDFPAGDASDLKNFTVQTFRHFYGTTAQNVYATLKKSNAEFIAEAYNTCIRYLTDYGR
jgi:hypothetical protein